MRKERIAAILLAAVLLTGGATGLRRATGEPEPETRAPARIDRPRSADAPRTVEFLSARPAAPAAAPAVAPHPAAPLAPESAALVAEIAELQSLAEGTDLELNTRQWEALGTVTLHLQAVRLAYEARIATSTALPAGRHRIEVPAYPSAGDALRAQFHAALRSELGEANAMEILEKLGSRLEGHFVGFGVSVQTLDLSPDPRGGGDYEVTRTAKYWNSVESENRLTTRREIFYPALQDPDGDCWGALLALAGD